jgi:uncharacterized repeat protein (TIGR03803 family)
MKRVPINRIAIAFAALAALALPAAATESVIQSFRSIPNGSLLRLHKSTLFGMTGAEYGVIFKLSQSGGSWKKKDIWKFNGADGAYPDGGLIPDLSGNLYGATGGGGSGDYGTVFELSHSSGWNEHVLYSFKGGGDGSEPIGDLIMDSTGNLYGVTNDFLSTGYGTVFEVTYSGGVWTKQTLYSFKGGSDGRIPFAGLYMDSSGVLYGTTAEGGGNLAVGTVFELSQSGGTWTETVLHSFARATNDGWFPSGVLVQDSKGDLFGTTVYGGTYDGGTVFELTRSGSAWTEAVLYSFGSGSDGFWPYAGLKWGSKRTLYGTTFLGGANDAGTVFELTQSAGVWSDTVLHSFGFQGDGYYPEGTAILDESGDVFGTTPFGGEHSHGTVWKITP